MDHHVKINFLGAAGVVTGSKFLIETSEKTILIDCGMFQGLKELRELNWCDLPIDVNAIDLVLLTHGHLDHVGYLPRLLKQGFQGKIVGTAPTLAIAEIILRDSAKIHEEEAERANKEKYTKHHPALPFYTVKDAETTIQLFEVEMEDKWIHLSEHISYRFQYNGHIIGATFIELDINSKRLVFSGDIGRSNDYLLEDPKRPEWADFLFVESTYGNKLHSEEDVEQILTDIILETIHKKGNLIIPSFAVERLQTLMYILWKLYQKNKIPNIPIFVDSPMGSNVLDVFSRFPKWHKLPMAEYNAMCNHVNSVQSYKETWETIDDKRSKIVIAGSGMVTGGRVLTYLQQLIDEPSTTVLLVGYQAEGTRGRQLFDGAHEIKFSGKYYPVKATVKHIESLSAHADQNGLLNWMSAIKNIPEKVYLIHGEPAALDAFRVKIKDTYNWNVTIPKLSDVETLVI
ncbi:MBL fold metallo-hydrolase [Subsaximicrobium wynnwilliamsii]|uniref:MBL fold metallo-hydrolase n=1 Tax=Subsaximicrobium wynnwilliamsii TaxID=291179 RepID=A0A5C6ZJU8_9FLAO|nr:MBL fold metallo-hydrolase [Subsaximicrobium wynnwilliamsii]TXD84418.1 MBL fold metallo-hydrolase [Subsaximicrobium wynnwilliamsii]TXD90099.1 MBL fold metallo-hydrolase [Subsaximicrobium wynnwilliamsii]TXE04151.1 MBL fold metallo-hydrolase [Subsaximicrobium wynnwilliamsii]